ncbi:MAG TPA: hypothetical protein VFW75_14240 [Acetobacteraceae bacterium]|nr:hypothetical protein [Acetobacteraceae bacterium]
MARFRHALLDPRPGEPAARSNAALLGPNTLGVEVTEPRLAAQCGLGNIDPQHRPGGGALAAIEAALDWPVPPAGATLVTIRPDADAYGAMAVLGLRVAGVVITSPMRERIAAIARADRFDRGAWPGVRVLPATAADVDEIGPGEQGVGGLAAGLGDRALCAEAGVAAVRAWIATAEAPMDWRQRAAGAAEALCAALASGRVRLSAVDPGRIALVEGCVPGALRLGYRLAPVVVALDDAPRGTPPAPWRRITVAQWRTGYVDLLRAAALLGSEEPGWGGAPGIIGSPQGSPCRRTLAQVFAALRTSGGCDNRTHDREEPIHDPA